MKRNNILLMSVLAVAIRLPYASPAVAQEQQIKATFVHLGQGDGLPGMLYEPVTPSDKSQIALYLMDATSDHMAFSACTEMAKRGYRVLCADNSADKIGSVNDANMDRILLEAKLGVAYLRGYPGVQKVVFFGHSGGGVLMSTYQNIAENGVKACQGPEKIVRCPDSLAGLPPADGLMLIDSNWGLAALVLFSLDPAVGDEDQQTLNPEFDLFSPKNGFNPAGSTYSDEFIRKYQGAEGKRNDLLIKAALDRLAAIKAGKSRYNDDEPFFVPGASFYGANNKLFPQDVELMSHTRKAWPLLRADGSVVTQVVHSVRVPENTASLTGSMERGALKTTVRTFLSTYAVRVTDDYGYDADSVHGVDWSSCYSCPPANVEGIGVPTLVMGMTGHWEYMASETIFEHSKSADKTLVYVEGATHNYITCTNCEKYPGQFGNTMKTTYDYVDSWLSKKGRFYSGGQP
jgi:hypothetical protein